MTRSRQERQNTNHPMGATMEYRAKSQHTVAPRNFLPRTVEEILEKIIADNLKDLLNDAVANTFHKMSVLLS